MRAWIAVTACAATLCACASAARPEMPAVLTNASAETHAELVGTISAALNVPTVTIAGDALTRDSLLVIERIAARDPSGQRLTGRDFDKPRQFRLLRAGRRCVLLAVDTGRKYDLTRSRCRPAR